MQESTHHKNELKHRLQKMSVKDLMETLQEFEKERLALECKMRQGGQSVMSYPRTTGKGVFGNLDRLKKDIARVKTILNIKLLQNNPKDGR